MTTQQTVAIEVCCDSVESVLAAEGGGADRVELCDNLFEGGTTPSAGAIEIARRSTDVKLHVIIRPRGGDFCYSEIEMEVMKRDIRIAGESGADGIVTGILTPEGDIDIERTRELIEIARPMSVTFHRAFDLVRDPCQSLEDLIALGIDRVLTSGQEASALEGIDLIAELVRRADGRTIILPGGGINERNIRRVVTESGAREVHVTGFVSVESPARYRNERVFMGRALRPSEYLRMTTDSEKISRIKSEAQFVSS